MICYSTFSFLLWIQLKSQQVGEYVSTNHFTSFFLISSQSHARLILSESRV